MKILFVIYFILIKFLLEQVFLLKTLSFNCLAIFSLAISSLAMDSNPVSKKLTLDGDPLVIVLDIMCCGGCAHPNDYLAILSKTTQRLMAEHNKSMPKLPHPFRIFKLKQRLFLN